MPKFSHWEERHRYELEEGKKEPYGDKLELESTLCSQDLENVSSYGIDIYMYKCRRVHISAYGSPCVCVHACILFLTCPQKAPRSKDTLEVMSTPMPRF